MTKPIRVISDKALAIAKAELHKTDSTVGHHVQTLIDNHEAEIAALKKKHGIPDEAEAGDVAEEPEHKAPKKKNGHGH